jgi:hypothetical protein
VQIATGRQLSLAGDLTLEVFPLIPGFFIVSAFYLVGE